VGITLVFLKLTQMPPVSYQVKKSYDVAGEGVKSPLMACAAPGEERKCYDSDINPVM
jgi:hypothetical protein